MKIDCRECVWREGMNCQNRRTGEWRAIPPSALATWNAPRPAWCPRKGQKGGLRHMEKLQREKARRAKEKYQYVDCVFTGALEETKIKALEEEEEY